MFCYCTQAIFGFFLKRQQKVINCIIFLCCFCFISVSLSIRSLLLYLRIYLLYFGFSGERQWKRMEKILIRFRWNRVHSELATLQFKSAQNWQVYYFLVHSVNCLLERIILFRNSFGVLLVETPGNKFYSVYFPLHLTISLISASENPQPILLFSFFANFFVFIFYFALSLFMISMHVP